MENSPEKGLQQAADKSLETALELARGIGFEHSGQVNMDALVPLEAVRKMCSADKCGAYGHNWSCPPFIGSLEYYQEKFLSYRCGILVQSVTDMEDEFDLEAIRKNEALHKKRFDTLVRQCAALIGEGDPGRIFPMSAGTCTRCHKCTCPDSLCRHPDKMFSSMEACGLMVRDVCEGSGFPYYNGKKTISVTSCILF